MKIFMIKIARKIKRRRKYDVLGDLSHLFFLPKYFLKHYMPPLDEFYCLI